MEGQINLTLLYLSEEDCGGVLPLSGDVMKQLTDKNPNAQEASQELCSLVLLRMSHISCTMK